MKLRSVAVLLGLAVILVGASAVASEKSSSKSKAPMATYLVISPHTAEQCMKALDAVNAKGSKELSMWEFGCESGDHTGYLMVKASSEEEALSHVPADLRAEAKAMKVNKFTAAQIADMHKKM